MKALLNNWWMALIAAVFGGIGWFAKDVNLNGVTGPGEPMALGGLTIGGTLGLLYLMFSKWQAAGGKLDGRVTDQEFDAVTDPLMERFAPGLKPTVDRFQGVIVPAINKVISPTATKLIDDISHWFVDKTPDPNEAVLNFKLLEVLADSDHLKDDPAVVSALATIRAKVVQAGTSPAAVPAAQQ